MRNRRGTILITGGLLLVAAALCLAGYNVWDGQRAGETAGAAVEKLNREIRSPELSPRPTGMVPDYILDPNMDMPEIEVDGYAYIGRIDIPALELSLPVLSSWSYPQLKLGPCRYAGSAYLDDLIIAAHNYTRHFGRLGELYAGDLVQFTDADGNCFSYTVEVIEQLMPDDVEEMASGGWDLTLFTCTLGGQSRVTVRCARIEDLAAG